MTTLLAIQHDPDGKLLKPLHKSLPLLNDLFREWHLVVTEDTHYDYMLLPWKVLFLKARGMAEARRDVLKLGLEREDDYYFYCDLDRLVYWITNKSPIEFQELVQSLPLVDYLVIGRKLLAFESHPPIQMETERVMNILTNEICGFDFDFFAGARNISHQAAKWISEESTANHAAQDIEWPLIVRDNGGILDYIEVSGLSYESKALDIQHSKEDELKLRMTNLQSVLEFLNG